MTADIVTTQVGAPVEERSDLRLERAGIAHCGER